MSGRWKHRGRLKSMVVAAEEGGATGKEASVERLFAADQEAATGSSAECSHGCKVATGFSSRHDKH